MTRHFNYILFYWIIAFDLVDTSQGSHRHETFLKMKGSLEKFLKTKFALKTDLRP